MTSPLAADPALLDLTSAVRSQAEEIAALDSGRAEAWASDVLAMAVDLLVDHVDPIAALVAALRGVDDDLSATALCALTPFVDGAGPAGWIGTPPGWAPVIGTNRCEAAWLLEARGSASVALRYVDAAEVRHVLTVDLLPGPPETIGEVIIGPGDLLDALQEEDAGVMASQGEPSEFAHRIVAAMRATDRPRESAVINGRLLVVRLAALTEELCDPPIGVEEDISPLAPRDPDDDAYAVEVLERALGLHDRAHVELTGALDAAADALAGLVAPADLAMLEPLERDAVMALECADWLGAIIGLVRAGEGTCVDGESLVDLINRCPEVTSTIPKSDRARIAWAFDTVSALWTDHGMLAGGCLTAAGIVVLPRALQRAWAPRS